MIPRGAEEPSWAALRSRSPASAVPCSALSLLLAALLRPSTLKAQRPDLPVVHGTLITPLSCKHTHLWDVRAGLIPPPALSVPEFPPSAAPIAQGRGFALPNHVYFAFPSDRYSSTSSSVSTGVLRLSAADICHSLSCRGQQR